MTNKIYKCAVIGNPIAHSKSPEIHHAFAKNYHLNLEYSKILAETKEDFVEIVKDFFLSGGQGLNITVPLKEVAFSICDELSMYAQKARAVNTLYYKNKKLYGDNTDGRGLLKAISEANTNIESAKILILGAGGAARGIIFPLLENKVELIHIYNRSKEKAKNLASDYSYSNKVTAIDDFKNSYDIIINATSAEVCKDNNTNYFSNNLPASLITKKTLCYDMMYGKKTQFMIWAENNGAKQILDGYSMLINQAEISFHIWFDEILNL